MFCLLLQNITATFFSGDEPAIGLAETLSQLGFKLGRLKTGTPPRIVKSSIDYSQLLPNHGDELPVPFSFMNERVWLDPKDQVQIIQFINLTANFKNDVTKIISPNNKIQ